MHERSIGFGSAECHIRPLLDQHNTEVVPSQLAGNTCAHYPCSYDHYICRKTL
jgi:hypothetical protein